MESRQRRLKAIFIGQVQGVSFRWYTEQAARGLKLTGTVRNLPDGTVEVFVEGAEQPIDDLVTYLCSPSGPGTVSKVERDWTEPSGEFSDFRIIY